MVRAVPVLAVDDEGSGARRHDGPVSPRLLTQLLLELAAFSAEPVDVAVMVQRVAATARELFDADGAVVLLGVDGDAREVVGSSGVVDAGTRTRSIPMRHGGAVVGELALHRTTPDDFGAAAVEDAQRLADVLAMMVVRVRTLHDATAVVSQLRHALTSRVVVEQAKGMVAADLGVTVEQALEHMRYYARPRQLRLADVAADIVARRIVVAALRP